MMENQKLSDINATSAPYLTNTLPSTSASSRNYTECLPATAGSLMDYMCATGASNYFNGMNGQPSSCSPVANTACRVIGTNTNIADQLEAKGLTWKAYMEDMRAPCYANFDTGLGAYSVEHNPFVYYTDIAGTYIGNQGNGLRCTSNDLQSGTSAGDDSAFLSQLNSSSPANYVWLSPDNCNNMHGGITCGGSGSILGVNDCDPTLTCIRRGNDYLQSLVPKILSSTMFTTMRSALFITFDECSCGPPPGPVYTVWTSSASHPTTKAGYSSTASYQQHFPLLKTLELNWGLSMLPNGEPSYVSAPAMTEFFSPPDFSISATSPFAVHASASATSTITITSLNGFTGTVNLSVSPSSPAGLTCTLPASVTLPPSPATATLSCSATVAGDYTVTVTGMSGALTHTTAAILFHVTDYTIAAGAVTPAQILAGASGTSTITVTAVNGFTGTVNLSVSASTPAGLTCTLAASVVLPPSTATATLSCSATTAGNYTVTVTGASGTLSHTTAAILFHVTDYTIAAGAVTPAQILAGASGTSTITVTAVNGFTGTINLSVSVSTPAGLTCTIPATVAIPPTPNTATVSCSATVAGDYTVTVTGAVGARTHVTGSILFHITDYTVAAGTVAPAQILAGGSGTSTITVTALNGFSGTVTLSASASTPAGLTCTLAASVVLPPSPATATLSCSATLAGNYTVTVTGASGTLSHTTATILFHVTDFTIAAGAVTPAQILAGSSGTSTVTVTAVNGFTGTVTLSVSTSSPAGVTCTLAASVVLPPSPATATLSCTATSAGNYNVTITGTSTPLTYSVIATFSFVDFTVTVTNPADFNTGSTGNSTITVTPVNGFSGTVALTITVAPSIGLTPNCPANLNVTTGSSTGRCRPSSTSPGIYLVTITAANRGLSHTARFISHVGDFSIAATSPTGNAGFAITSNVTLTSSENFAGSVALTATVPAGLVCGAFTPTPVTLTANGTGTSKLSCTSATPGTYSVTITAAGSPGTASHSTTATFAFAPFDFSITASSPADFNSGATGNSTITVTPIGNFAGTVTLTTTVSPATGLAANCPANLIVFSGAVTGTCTPTSSSPNVFMVNVTGTGGGHIHSAVFFSHVGDFSMSTTSPTGFAGSLLNSTITLTSSQNFAGSITLTDTLPTGPSCDVFSPSPVTLAKNGTSSSRLSCSSTVAGTFTVTISGAGSPGNASRIATAVFNFTDFTIRATPPAPVNAGVFANSNVTIAALNGFAGTVTLGYAAPNGLSCDPISPPSIAGGSGNATVSCRATIAGNYILTVTGTSGSLKHNATATFRFQDFTIAASTPVPVNVGISVSSTITVTAVNGFGGTTTLSDTGATGLSCGPITPINVTASGSASVSCSAAVAGNYTLTITGRSAALVHNATVTFQFQDFTITTTTPPTTVNAGTSVTATVTIASTNGFAGTVNLNDTIPSGLTCGAITPANVTKGSGTATVSCSATVAANYVLTITGTNGALVRSTTAIFKFVNFTITATSRSGNANSAIVSTITVSPVNGFVGVVNLTDTIPSGLTCGPISPNSITGGSGTATVSCTASLAGNYVLTVTGTNGTLTHSTTAIFRVQDFSIIASLPAPVNVGQSTSSTVTVTAVNGFNGTVNFSISTPSGLVCGTIAPANVTGSGSAIVSCSATVAANYNVTITGTSASLSHSVVATFKFQDFQISANPTTVTVNAATAGASTVTVASLNGFARVVNLTTNSTSCNMSPTNVTGSGLSTLSCTFAGSGVVHVTVTGTSSNLSHSTTVTYTVQDFMVTASLPPPVNVGTPATTTITVSPLNGFTGTVALTDTVPSGLTCGAITPNSVTRSGTATISCYAVVAGNYTLTVTGTNGSLSHSVTAIFSIQDFTITARPITLSVAVGQSGTSTLTVSPLNGFTGPVTLTSSASPSGLNRALTPTSVTLGGSQNSTLTVRATTPGSYTVIVMAKSGALSHNVTLTVIVSDRPLVSVVVGPDGSLYWNSISATGSAAGWQALGGTTPSAPALCQSGPGGLELVVRGMDNGIYHKSFTSGTWSSTWDSPGGATNDQPACAVLNGTLYLVVRGLNNVTYANSMSLATLTWSGWTNLDGQTPSAPVLVVTPSANRLDLVVRGLANGIYHRAFVNGAWAATWDTPGGTTPDIPAAVSNGSILHLVVRGMNNGLWYNSYNFTSGSWSSWFSIGGATATAPSLAIDSGGTLHLLVTGLANGIWHISRTAAGVWSPTWDSPGGATSNRIAVTTIGTNVIILATGLDNSIYLNVLTGTSWQTWTAMGGETLVPIALSSIP